MHIWFGCSCFKCLLRGFTKFSHADYLKYKSESRIVPDGVNAKLHLHVDEISLHVAFLMLEDIHLFIYTWIWICLKHILHSIDFFKVIFSLSSLQVGKIHSFDSFIWVIDWILGSISVNVSAMIWQYELLIALLSCIWFLIWKIHSLQMPIETWISFLKYEELLPTTG